MPSWPLSVLPAAQNLLAGNAELKPEPKPLEPEHVPGGAEIFNGSQVGGQRRSTAKIPRIRVFEDEAGATGAGPLPLELELEQETENYNRSRRRSRSKLSRLCMSTFGHVTLSSCLKSSWPLGFLLAARQPPGQSVLSGALGAPLPAHSARQAWGARRDDREIAQWIQAVVYRAYDHPGHVPSGQEGDVHRDECLILGTAQVEICRPARLEIA